MTRLLCGLALLLATAACGPTRRDDPDTGTCDPSNCQGCCSSDGICFPGIEESACGGEGLACAACEAGASCVDGACVGHDTDGGTTEPDGGTTGPDGGTTGPDGGTTGPDGGTTGPDGGTGTPDAGTPLTCGTGFAAEGGVCTPVLSALVVSGRSLTPAFGPTTTSYELTVAAPSITVTAASAAPGALISINGQPGVAATVALGGAGFTATVTIDVLAGATRRYTLVVTRQPYPTGTAASGWPDVDTHFAESLAFARDGSVLLARALPWSYDRRSQESSAERLTRDATGRWAVTSQHYVRDLVARPGSQDDPGLHKAATNANGRVVVLGNPFDRGQATESYYSPGAVGVYRSTDGVSLGTPVLLQAPLPHDATERFGASVALSDDGNLLFVGSAGVAYNPANGREGVRIYAWSGTRWTELHRITSPRSGVQMAFAGALAVSGDGSTLAVGAYREPSSSTGIGGAYDTGTYDAGAVFLYGRSGNTWSLAAFVKPSVNTRQGKFGRSLALSADGATLVVGAADAGSDYAGRAYVFRRSGTTWSQNAVLQASNAEGGDQFGWAVDIAPDGTSIVVGAPEEDGDARGLDGDASNEGATNSGAAYLFRLVNGAWTQAHYLKDPASVADIGFGTSVAHAPGVVAVGAPWQDVTGPRGTVTSGGTVSFWNW